MKKIITKVKNILKWIISILINFWNYLLKHYFSINFIYATMLIILVLWTKDTSWDIDTGTLTWSHISFLKFAINFWVVAFMLQAIHLFMFEQKIKKYKQDLNSKWFLKFIEYEYKKNDASILSGLWYILGISIWILAIYVSFISMSVSLDIVSSKDWIIKLEWTIEMLKILAWWIWVLIIVFPIYFFGYKFNQLSKCNFLEKKYYWEFKK